MATLTAIAFNFFEAIGLAQPQIEVTVREPQQYEASEHPPLRMRWVRETDSNGRKIMRVQWKEDIQQTAKSISARGAIDEAEL